VGRDLKLERETESQPQVPITASNSSIAWPDSYQARSPDDNARGVIVCFSAPRSPSSPVT
jgi:hypothetical protein